MSFEDGQGRRIYGRRIDGRRTHGDSIDGRKVVQKRMNGRRNGPYQPKKRYLFLLRIGNYITNFTKAIHI